MFGRYLVLVGATRFLVELLRVNVPVLAGLTMAQLFSIAAVALGAALLVRRA